jgi:asparagine synthase (glutamine-hydrolysing)
MGSLGDMLFVQSGLLWPAADYLHHNGVNGRFVKVVLDVAQNNRVSVWRVLSHAIRDGLVKPPKGTWNPYEVAQREHMVPTEGVLMCGDAIEDLRKHSCRLVHPWLRAVDGVPPGKLLLIAAVAEEGYYASPFKETNDPPIIAPFLSQPLTELCLQIPTYLSVMDGWDRAVARRAFARELPAEIIRRSSKGSPSSWLKEVINRDAQFIREFLLDGLLVRARLLDRGKLEQALPGVPTKTGAYAGHILNLLYTEAWLRSWSEDRGCAVAAA